MGYSQHSTARGGKCQSLSRVHLFATPWTVARQATLSMKFSRQEYWSRSPCSPPGDLPDPGIEPGSPALQADSLLFVPPGKPPLNTEILINLLFFFKKRIVGWFVNVKLTLGWMQPITDTSSKRQCCQIPTTAVDNGTYRTDAP